MLNHRILVELHVYIARDNEHVQYLMINLLSVADIITAIEKQKLTSR